MNEPDWATMGYHAGGAYGAECNICDTVVELDFGRDREHLLTIKHKDDVYQDQLFAFMFYWVLIKLERECDCSEEKRESYEPVTFGADGKRLNTLRT